ncbi:transposase [Streptomyces sp. NPDC050560]|uniref:transposase n=1 Tax=Streptomyces sp. NPDC050560 TaxID=3365630 RepID=UPI00379B3EA7
METGILRFQRKKHQVGSKYTKRYTEELKRDTIALVDSSGKTVTAVARELGISSESLRGWYRRAKADRGEGAPGG